MQIIVDGIIFRSSQHGGIVRVFSEIMPRICALDDRLKMTVFTVGASAAPIPQAKGLTSMNVPDMRKFLRPGRWFNPCITSALQDRVVHWRTGPSQEPVIWHPSYFVLPKHSRNSSFVVTVHDMIYELFPELFSTAYDDEVRQLKKRCIQEADAIICDSATTANDVRRFYPEVSKRIRVIHLGCSFGSESRQSAASAVVVNNTKRPFLLYVGRRDHYKNFQRVLDAFAVWRYRNEADLYVVGPRWTPGEESCIHRLGLSESITHVNNISDEALSGLYSRASAFIYPSLYEGFGLPLLEAVAAGCPIIASHIPSTIEVIGTYPTYFEPTSTEDLIRALSVVFEQGRRGNLMQSTKDILDRFSWDRTAQLTLECYRDVWKGNVV